MLGVAGTISCSGSIPALNCSASPHLYFLSSRARMAWHWRKATFSGSSLIGIELRNFYIGSHAPTPLITIHSGQHIPFIQGGTVHSTCPMLGRAQPLSAQAAHWIAVRLAVAEHVHDGFSQYSKRSGYGVGCCAYRPRACGRIPSTKQ